MDWTVLLSDHYIFCILVLHNEEVVHTMLGARCYTDIHQVCTPKSIQTKGSATQMQKETNKRKAASLEWHQKSTKVVGRVRGCPIPNLALICFLRTSWSVSHFFSLKKSSQVNNRTEKKKSVILYIHANKQKANKSHHQLFRVNSNFLLSVAVVATQHRITSLYFVCLFVLTSQNDI